MTSKLLQKLFPWFFEKESGPFDLSWAELFTPFPYSEPDEIEKLRHFTPIAIIECSDQKSKEQTFQCLKEGRYIFAGQGNRYTLSHREQLERLQRAGIAYKIVEAYAERK